MLREAPWRAPLPRPRSAASSESRSMAEPPQDWTPHLGRKVSLRYVLHDSSVPQTEVLGVVQALSTESDGATVIKVMDKRGQTHVVYQRDIVAAKVF